MFEQGVLSTLEAFQGKRAWVRMLPGDLGFMIRKMPLDTIVQREEGASCLSGDSNPQCLPPVKVQGYGRKGKPAFPTLDSV